MLRRIAVLGIALLVLACAGLLLLGTRSTRASGLYSNNDLWGSYSSQLSGTLVFPAGTPGSQLNGPYCLNGRVEADGQGNARGTVYDNYNGLLINYSWQGVYQVNKDGTLTVTAALPFALPGFPTGQAYVLVMHGVICDGGKQVRLTQIGPTLGDLKVPGVPPNFLGTIITGSWIRQ